MMLILVPMDGSELSLRALDHALALRAEQGLEAEITLFNVSLH